MRPTFPFRKHQRLLKPIEFKSIFLKPYRISERYFTVLAKSNSLGYARLGLAVSKKQARRAVQRNRLKRLIRESFRIHQHSLPAWDYVVFAKEIAQEVNNTLLLETLIKQWQQFSQQNKKF